MVTEIDLKETTETGLVKAKEIQTLYDYAIMIPLLCLIVLFGVKVYLGATKFFATKDEQLLFSGLLLGTLALSLYTWFRIKHSKRLKPIRTDLTKKANQSLIENVLTEIEFNILISNQQYIIATTHSNLLVGQEVTVILGKGEVWVNVRPSVGMKGRFPFSFGKSKKVMNQIQTEIQNHLTRPKPHQGVL
jgi:hypothetical protein